MNDNLYGVQDIRWSTSVDLSKGIVVCPLLYFYFFFSFFYFFYFFGGLNGSFYLTLICPLWDLLILSTLGSFPHFRGNTLYFTRSIGDLSHFTKSTQHKENVTIMMQMYASVRVAEYAMILARHVAMIRAGPN